MTPPHRDDIQGLDDYDRKLIDDMDEVRQHYAADNNNNDPKPTGE